MSLPPEMKASTADLPDELPDTRHAGTAREVSSLTAISAMQPNVYESTKLFGVAPSESYWSLRIQVQKTPIPLDGPRLGNVQRYSMIELCNTRCHQ